MFWKIPLILPFLFGALPSTNTYQLNNYGFGSGGTANSSTPTYSLEGASGEVSGPGGSTANYNLKPGYIESQQANVPKISAFDNGSGRYYNKLHFVIDEQNNPNDAKYALQISTSSTFASGNSYVKSDLTLGATLNTTDYQTYAAWGSTGGSIVTTLSPNTTYYLRAKATQGIYTESAYGPSMTVTTANPSISFSVSPTSVSLGNLLPNVVTSASSSISLTFDTNADSGGKVFISAQFGGLRSAAASYTITSATGDLSSLSNGFGAQVTASGQTSGGPFSGVGPYISGSNNVGITDSTIRNLLSSANQVNAGTASVMLKAKAAPGDPAQNDYQELLTVLASASF